MASIITATRVTPGQVQFRDKHGSQPGLGRFRESASSSEIAASHSVSPKLSYVALTGRACTWRCDRSIYLRSSRSPTDELAEQVRLASITATRVTPGQVQFRDKGGAQPGLERSTYGGKPHFSATFVLYLSFLPAFIISIFLSPMSVIIKMFHNFMILHKLTEEQPLVEVSDCDEMI